MNVFRITLKDANPRHLFMVSIMVVNGGNYVYNLLLGRLLGPEVFADASLLIIFLAVLCLVGTTFQFAITEFAARYTNETCTIFKNYMYLYAIVFGVIAGGYIIIFSESFQAIFQTQNHYIFIIFAFALPLYFVMCVNRGRFQGIQDFGKLTGSYQTETFSKLILTFVLLYLIPLQPTLVIAISIALSFVYGFIPSSFNNNLIFSRSNENRPKLNKVKSLIGLTAAFEMTQIVINHSDILLVKHFFNATDAGLYASLALIGRGVYFMSWMFVMLSLPAVFQKKQDGMPAAPVLLNYILSIGTLALSILLACYFVPELIITLTFGEGYVSMAPLLWQYTLATSLFAISNIFTYYYLLQSQYTPVILSGVFGISQIILIIINHSSLAVVVQGQIALMLGLLLSQLLFFLSKDYVSKNQLGKVSN